VSLYYCDEEEDVVLEDEIDLANMLTIAASNDWKTVGGKLVV